MYKDVILIEGKENNYNLSNLLKKKYNLNFDYHMKIKNAKYKLNSILLLTHNFVVKQNNNLNKFQKIIRNNVPIKLEIPKFEYKEFFNNVKFIDSSKSTNDIHIHNLDNTVNNFLNKKK